MVVHALTYLLNVGLFWPSLAQSPNLTSLMKLQYTSARKYSSARNLSIVAHALTYLPNVGPGTTSSVGPGVPIGKRTHSGRGVYYMVVKQAPTLDRHVKCM